MATFNFEIYFMYKNNIIFDIILLFKKHQQEKEDFTMINLETLKEIDDLHSIWPHEALDFTPWLAREENIARLSDAIGIDITVEATESAVGDFSLDILASETGTGKKIVIENQLEKTNHDHLGKLITYAAGNSANYIIWVVKQARNEHKAAIEWLNNHTDEGIEFFLIEIKLYKIGESNTALKFELVEQPNGWTKELKKTGGKITKNQQIIYNFWTYFYDDAFKNEEFKKNFRKRNYSYRSYININSGIPGCIFAIGLSISKEEISAELYINDNKKLFDYYSFKNEIETACDLKLIWQRLDNKKASRIKTVEKFDIYNQNSWQYGVNWSIEKLLKLKKVFMIFYEKFKNED